jgi:hypothetical protein
MGVRDIDGLLKPQSMQFPKDPATENADVLDGMSLKAFAGQQHDAHMVSHMVQGMSPMLQANPMAAVNLQKHVLEHIRIKAEEQVEAELFTQYGADPGNIVSQMQKEGAIALRIATAMSELRALQSNLAGEDQQASDPLVELKKQEIQANAQTDQAKITLDQQKLQQDGQLDLARIQSQEKIAMLRVPPAFKGGQPNATQKGQ